jgi:hypothetical protein
MTVTFFGVSWLNCSRVAHDAFFWDASRKRNFRTLTSAELGSGRPERAEVAFGHALIEVLEIVARQADVLPAERRDVLEQVGVGADRIP